MSIKTIFLKSIVDISIDFISIDTISYNKEIWIKSNIFFDTTTMSYCTKNINYELSSLNDFLRELKLFSEFKKESANLFDASGGRELLFSLNRKDNSNIIYIKITAINALIANNFNLKCDLNLTSEVTIDFVYNFIEQLNEFIDMTSP